MKIKNKVIIGLVIIVFGIYLFFIQSGIAYKDKLIIFISFVGLFATFCGAYIGAKISGDNARKILLHQLTINSLEKKFEKNKEFIEETNRLTESTDFEITIIRASNSSILKLFKKRNMNKYLINIFYRLKCIDMLLNDYKKTCNDKKLNVKEMSVQILKDFEDTKRIIVEISRFYKNIERFIESNAIKKWCDKNKKDSYISNKMSSYIDNVDVDNIIVIINYSDKEEKVELSMDDAFLLQNQFFILKQIFQLHRNLSKYNKRNIHRDFRNEQDIVNYIDKLYAQL
ncbi:hypothetical protein [Staphylococcus haemolyticus]|uniref:hypothetical protein n=1 Tax=Staphylococcus haemolyticus TaxID=1283 RepID=UPI0026521952|nr:hypothetical protein [Staphylococcus haemolyticus]MDN7233062.1 hypothetical protein [Staphylococcus haemolyticus]